MAFSTTYNGHNNTMDIHCECPECADVKTINVNFDQFGDWQSGKLIQSVFPELSEDDRERMISGICPKCWELYETDIDDEI